MSNNILQNFSTNYKQVLIKSINLAWQLNTEIIKPEYILYSLISQKGSIGSEILLKAKLKEADIKKKLIKSNGPQKNDFLPYFTDETVQLIEKSAALAFKNNHPYIATEHLLLAIIESQETELQKILNQQKINLDFIKNQIQIIFNSTSKFHDFTSSFDELPEQNYHELRETSYPTATKTSLLKAFTTDLTDKQIQKNIDPLIGREEEISRLIEILMRRTKNNPLILGDPGVGKTALVEGLAKKIITGQVPEILADKKILALDLALVIAGTMFRGEFENRMKNILDEIKKDPNIIIFIDEIHNIIGAGSTQGAMDVANILKPALARGEIRCIGATTYEEYKKHLENDAALERRFQLVKMQEPSADETFTIIQGIKSNYENYHNVKITDQAIATAVYLSEKYITDRFFPDKAIDLIDESASSLKIKQKTNKLTAQLKQAKKELEQIQNDKEKNIIQEDFKQAILLKIKEKEKKEQIQKIKNLNKTKNKKQIVTKNEITQIVSKITNIPNSELLLQEKKKFLNLEKNLAKHIIGQDNALNILAQSIRRNKAGIAEQNKPLGAFILIGPSGTGKTYTARILNQILFENQNSLIKIDMSEFSEKFNISKLIGAPAGYVGYKESGKLTDAVKRNPNSIVLFDEIEKAHSDVFNLLLQILDDGYLADATGKKINFKNTLIIMTSNLGSKNLSQIMGFDKNDSQQNDLTLEKEIKNFFPPEFVNRLDKIIIFNQLDKKSLNKIIKIELENLQTRLKKQNIELNFEPKIINFLLNTNFRQEQGARFIKQNIEELIANPLSEKLFQQNTDHKYKIKIKNNNLQIINA
ncbi:MAG: AAA domain-containing protein|nr:AAA domain-containing protein [Candidatus Buchananbacteria bacterium]